MTDEELQKRRSEQAAKIVERISEYDREALGPVTDVILRMRVRVEPDEAEIDRMLPEGEFRLFIGFENTIHMMTFAPYVAASTEPEVAASWVVSLMNQIDLPPDIDKEEA